MRVVVVSKSYEILMRKWFINEEIRREGEKPQHMRSIKQEGKVLKGSFQEIADMLSDEKEKMMEPSAYNILIYNDLKAFRENFSQYSRALLPENEIIVIGSQYDTTSDVRTP